MAFYQAPLALTLEQWHMALDSQAQAFLLGVQTATRLRRTAAASLPLATRPVGAPAVIIPMLWRLRQRWTFARYLP